MFLNIKDSTLKPGISLRKQNIMGGGGFLTREVFCEVRTAVPSYARNFKKMLGVIMKSI